MLYLFKLNKTCQELTSVNCIQYILYKQKRVQPCASKLHVPHYLFLKFLIDDTSSAFNPGWSDLRATPVTYPQRRNGGRYAGDPGRGRGGTWRQPDTCSRRAETAGVRGSFAGR